MDYASRAEAAKKAGEGKRISVKRIVLEPKASLLGVFLGRELITAKKKGFPDSYSYKWDTDTGVVTCFISSNFDKNDGSRLTVGTLYELTYLGKRKLSEGRELKEFELMDYGLVEDVEGEEGKEE